MNEKGWGRKLCQPHPVSLLIHQILTARQSIKPVKKTPSTLKQHLFSVY